MIDRQTFKHQDYRVAFDAAHDWLKGNGLRFDPGIIQALVIAIVDAVDEARSRRQQEH